MAKGTHLLVDCNNVPENVCLNDKYFLDNLAWAVSTAGATIINQMRYKFGSDSPPGFAIVVMLDESHCSAHSYAEERRLALDIFTCGKTDPMDVFSLLNAVVNLGTYTIKIVERFI